MFYLLARHIRTDLADIIASETTREAIEAYLKEVKEHPTDATNGYTENLDWEYKIIEW